jgi:quercetin dioxygenase-like cupin family protein
MNPMHRMLALVVSFSLLLVAPVVVAAQATPTTAEPTISVAGFGEIPDLPAGAGTLRLLRVTIQPGGALPWNVGREQATAGAVHEGEVALHFESEGLRQPYNGDPIAIAPGTVVRAVATDGFYAGKETTFTILNVSSAPAVVFLGTVEPNAWAPVQPVSRFINFDLVQSELLGAGVIPELLSGPSAILVARVVYEPGQGDAKANPSGGPAIAYVETGEFTYGLESGMVELTTAAAGATPVANQMLAPGSTVTLHTGDAVFEQDAVTLIRNDGTDRAAAIAVVLVPTAD